MKKGTGVFIKTEEQIDVCDFCEKKLGENEIVFNFRWTDGYSDFGDQIEVCSVECLVDELRTRNRDVVFHGANPSIRLSMSPYDMEELLDSALGTIFTDRLPERK